MLTSGEPDNGGVETGEGCILLNTLGSSRKPCLSDYSCFLGFYCLCESEQGKSIY